MASTQRRVVVCHHGERAVLRISGTKENPGRRFWGSCIMRHCDFFEWADQQLPDEDIDSVQIRKLPEEEVAKLKPKKVPEEDVEKVRLRKKVLCLKSKMKVAEWRVKIVALIGMTRWLWLFSI
ncbi:hypothetical protein PIB30_020512 [Stylosanthes scabra]|uniref:GRF-type domain-containing protein n=1 Tax=Stylosanthes scabra TaxID=79078 RepID=A0ABU6X609_9FABA|nr:hypothetical protein [Stylosanthes scabra]